MFYGVYYYDVGYEQATVYLAGYYETLNDAKMRLDKLIPNYVRGHKNSVIGNGRIGWVNKCEFGDFKHNDLSCNQPYSSVNLFEK